MDIMAQETSKHPREINYRFALNEAIVKDVVYVQLSFDLEGESQTISITIPSSGVLGIDVDSKEEADDLHKRLTWLPSWTSEPTASMATTFDEIDCDFIYTVDSGILELGANKDDLQEYFLYGDTLKGLLLLERHDIYSLNSNVMSHKWDAKFYPITETPRPYVLTDQAVTLEWIPPEGVSGLPKRMKHRVPDRLKYWKNHDESQRKAIRNHLITELSEGHIFIPYNKAYNSHFVLFKEETNEDNKGIYQLLIKSNKLYQFTMHESPLERPEIIARMSGGLSIEDGKGELIELEGHSYRAIDWGTSTIFEEYDDKLVIEFNGAKHDGIWNLCRQSNRLWDITLSKSARNKRYSVTPDKVDVIIQMSQDNIDRPRIAEAIGYSNQTVWVYQKKLGLV